MDDKNSLFELSGLPEGFGVVLLVFFFVLTLAPYMAGADIGVFKVPKLESQTKKLLRITAPIIFSVVILAFIPFWSVQKVASPIEPHVGELPSPTKTTTTNPSVPKDLPQGGDSLENEEALAASAPLPGSTENSARSQYFAVDIMMDEPLFGATIKVDDKIATIIESSPTITKVRVGHKNTNHKISLEKEGRVCTKEQLITRNQETIIFTLRDCN